MPLTPHHPCTFGLLHAPAAFRIHPKSTEDPCGSGSGSQAAPAALADSPGTESSSTRAGREHEIVTGEGLMLCSVSWLQLRSGGEDTKQIAACPDTDSYPFICPSLGALHSEPPPRACQRSFLPWYHHHSDTQETHKWIVPWRIISISKGCCLIYHPMGRQRD